MSQTSGAEEFDPKTGQFRPIRRRAAKKLPRKSETKAERPKIAGLSESGQNYGVFYEAFEHAAMSPTGTFLYRAAQVVMAVIFVLLIYEAISYRMAMGG